MFLKLYKLALTWAKHPKANRYLGAVSFAESSFFPIPPDVLLAPMCLSSPNKAYSLALLTTITSVLGGMLGYLLGWGAFEWVHAYIVAWGYEAAYHKVSVFFDHYGVWTILVAATITPIPYKLFTIGAGVMQMPFLPFVIASFFGRASRFYLVACLAKHQAIDRFMHRYVDRLGWGLTLIAGGFVAFLWLAGCQQQPPAMVTKTAPSTLSTNGKYQVVQGDTVYSVAWLYDLDPSTLATMNHIRVSSPLQEGQLLTVVAIVSLPVEPVTAIPIPSTHVYSKPIQIKKLPTRPEAPELTLKKGGRLTGKVHWFWPSQGKIVGFYKPEGPNRGLNFTGKVGDSVYATGKGQVVYAGQGIRGLGKLVILKHNDDFLSAYAHNDILLVKEGQQVQAGDKIATLGKSDTDKPMLHFEIRKKGKPVNPLAYLPR
jgi:membrane protein YqaA with SNARE-associated domain